MASKVKPVNPWATTSGTTSDRPGKTASDKRGVSTTARKRLSGSTSPNERSPLLGHAGKGTLSSKKSYDVATRSLPARKLPSATSHGTRSPSPQMGRQKLADLDLDADDVTPLADIEARNYQRGLGKVKLGTLPGIQQGFGATSKPERLVPTPDDPTAYLEDANAFSVDIEAFHDTQSYFSRIPQRQVVRSILADRRGAPFESLEEAATKISELRPAPRISSSKPHKKNFFVTHSLTNQYDIIARPKILNPELRRRLGLQNDPNCSVLQTQHVTLKNGFNGLSYKSHDGTVVTLKTAVAGSWDRESERVQMCRRIAGTVRGKADPSAPSYCYTGRPDTFAKAREQAEAIFFGELDSSKPKGLKADKHGVYTLDYAVNSVQLNADLNRVLPSEQEQLYFEDEKKALAELQRGAGGNPDGTYTLKDPRTGETYKVRFRPMLFSRQVNWASNVAKAFDPWTTGTKDAADATREGWNQLKGLVTAKLGSLQPDQKKLANQLIVKLEDSINGNCEFQMSETEELLCRTMLCMLVNLPIVWHCKSSTDRTSVVVAMNAALEQWVKLKRPIPEDFVLLLKDEYFKELFALNWIQGQQLTRNARSPDGMITQLGKLRELDHESLGISVNKDIAQCTLLKDLLPKRYLKDNSCTFLKRVGLTLVSPLTALGITLGFNYSKLWVAGLGKWNYIVMLIPAFLMLIVTFPLLIYNIIKGLLCSWRMVPSKVVDMESAGVGPRRLTKEASEQESFTTPLRAIPANAHADSGFWNSPMDVYNKHFRARFCQTDRVLRHRIDTNFIKTISDTKHQMSPAGVDARTGKRTPAVFASTFQDDRGKPSQPKIFAQLAREMGNNVTWEIDGHAFDGANKTPQHIYRYLISPKRGKNKLSHEAALQLMCAMQASTSSAADQHLRRILTLENPTDPASPLVQVLPNPRTARVALDTKNWTLRVENYNMLRENHPLKPDAAGRVVHAEIKTSTILNCRPGHAEFGHGTVEYGLVPGTDYVPFEEYRPPVDPTNLHAFRFMHR